MLYVIFYNLILGGVQVLRKCFWGRGSVVCLNFKQEGRGVKTMQQSAVIKKN